MPAQGSSLVSKAFGEHADAGLIVAYQSHQEALRFLSTALGKANGIALLQGPTGSGKTTIVNEQLGWSSRDAVVAIVDGFDLTPRRLITDMLSQFDVQTVSQHDQHMLQPLSDFMIRQTRSARAPVLIIDNADRATTSALRLLDWLSALNAGSEYALRIVLTGRERMSTLVWRDGMRSLAQRNPATYSLNPLTAQETMIYLRTRLIAAGGERSEKVFPVDVCDQLRESSRGWPGPLNQVAIEVMERMTEQRPSKPVPRVIVTCDGKTMAEHELTQRQYLIGRDELADIAIDDSYVSKMHALLQIYSNVIVLLDLNSTNGTTVNSTDTPKTILRNNDIIAIGRHRLKIENVPAISAEVDEQISFADTLTMRDFADIRRTRALHTIAALKHK